MTGLDTRINCPARILRVADSCRRHNSRFVQYQSLKNKKVVDILQSFSYTRCLTPSPSVHDLTPHIEKITRVTNLSAPPLSPANQVMHDLSGSYKIQLKSWKYRNEMLDDEPTKGLPVVSALLQQQESHMNQTRIFALRHISI